MSSSIHSSPAPPATGHRLFAALVDDAGLFPSAELPMAAAADRHRRDAALVTEARRMDAMTADRVRTAFMSFGSCNTADPIEDLSGLDLLSGRASLTSS